MKIIPYLNFNGQCEEALHFYERALGAKIICIMDHTGTPMENETPVEWHKKILHAQIEIDGQMIMASDAPPNHYQAAQGTQLSLHFTDTAEAEQIYHALLEGGGEVQMPLQETFWALKFAMLTDKFGTPWMINCGQPNNNCQ